MACNSKCKFARYYDVISSISIFMAQLMFGCAIFCIYFSNRSDIIPSLIVILLFIVYPLGRP